MIIDGKKLQSEVKDKLINKINNISDKLKLVVIQVGDDPASSVYVRNKGKLCNDVGILFEHVKYDDSILEKELISKIDELNNDSSVTGILVQLPLPSSINEDRVLESIKYYKDVDGLTSDNIGNLFAGNDGIVPCTALGVMEILDSVNTDFVGANVVIVGRSKLVGLPLVSLFSRRNSTVTLCHSKTKDLKSITSNADILVVAVGKKEFIDGSYVKDGSIVVDVGINRYEGKLYGDCEFSSVLPKVKYITPVPGGVGPLTVVMLVNNVIKAYELQKKL